uniref:Eukaryotic translation initiation factor 3 subunit M n=1 Tax=Timspurckia oligopyrenoides TaxID=708627 RepID=A0A7S0ZIH8_9RHOD|mmetsp:Transcript_666/g.1201  ORF Transcript_666/g.1201 Transcript_666/m.1201 type:complete len:434 (+) Transcript_666:34-1335(+)
MAEVEMNGVEAVGVTQSGNERILSLDESRGIEVKAACDWLCKYSSNQAEMETLTGPIRSAEISQVTTKENALLLARALGSGFRSITLAESVAAFADEASTIDRKRFNSSFEGAVQVTVGMLAEYADMDGSAALELGDSVASKSDGCELRLRALSLLYNAVSESTAEGIKVRFQLLLRMISLAQNAHKSALLRSVFDKSEQFADSWSLSLVDRRVLFDAISTALLNDGFSNEAHEYELKALKSVDSNETAADADRAAKTVVSAIRLDSRFRLDELLEIPSVQALESSNALLWGLLNILVTGSLSDYTAYASKNGPFLESELRLSHEALLTKMRLLTFASLGMDKQELTYDEVSSALDVPKSETEMWVVRAISFGLVDARMDQIQQKVTIIRSTQRVFTKEHWKPLHDRITLWKNNLDELSSILSSNRSAFAEMQ